MRIHMNLLQNLIMGFVSGFAELLPISAEAHRAILCRLFGVESEGSLFRLLIHIACLAAVIYGCRNEIRHIRRVRRLMKRDGIDGEYAAKRIDAQQPEKFFTEKCDYCLRNDGDLRDFEKKCQDLLEQILGSCNSSGGTTWR